MQRPGKEKDTTLTPLWLIEKLGEFDFDPCGYENHKTASAINVWPSCGLKVDWFGSVWLNPPYSNVEPWLEKLAKHGDGVAFVLASTDTAWFHKTLENASYYLFLKGRPKFLRTDGSEVSLMRASVLIEFGNKNRLANSGLDGFLIKRLQNVEYPTIQLVGGA